MAHLRATLIPLEHLIAEIAAVPVSSEAAFAAGITTLEPLMNGRSGASGRASNLCGDLWRRTETRLLQAHPGVSVEELTAIRDRIWFDMPQQQDRRIDDSVPLDEYVVRLAQTYLRVRGHSAVPCLRWDYARSPGLEVDVAQKPKSREAWRWLSFAVPPDLLLAALTGSGQSPCEVDSMASPWDRTLEDEGFAETHLHLGAALDFRQAWAATVTQLGVLSVAVPPDAFTSPGAEMNEGRDMAPWLLRAALVRYLLGAWLKLFTDQGREEVSFQNFVDVVIGLAAPGALSGVGPSVTSHLAVLRSRVIANIGVTGCRRLSAAIRRFNNVDGSHLSVGFGHVRSAYATLIRNAFRFPLPRKLISNTAWPHQAGLLSQDPMNDWFPFDPRTGTGSDLQFLKAALCHLKERRRLASLSDSTPVSSDEFARCFWHVVRIQGLYYRHLVLRPMTPGLHFFVRAFDRPRPAKRGMSTAMLTESASRISGLGKGLRSLEIRTSPESSSADVRRFLHEAEEAFQTAVSRNGATDNCCDRTEFGVVFHIVRHREGGWDSGRPNAHWLESQADPSAGLAAGGKSFRFVQFYRRTLIRVQAIARTLLDYPLTLRVLRGLDACTDELGVPTWVIAPFFRYLQDVSCRVSAELEQHGIQIPPLKTTVHAGEDFVHLLGGLRRVDEALRYLGLREGDRIGHGVALGIDPEEWARSASRVPVSREERLLDLTWEWSQYAREGVACPEGRQIVVERQLEQLCFDLFNERLTFSQLELFMEVLHDEAALAYFGFPSGGVAQRSPMRPAVARVISVFGQSVPGNNGTQAQTVVDLVGRYLRDRRIFERGREIIWVDTGGEADAVGVLQRGLRSRIASQEICVEINPSSNLLIAHQGELERHQLWRLNPPDPDSPETPIPVCIGSDDPLTFATDLRNEFTLVRDTLINQQKSSALADRWTELARANGLKFRFTLTPKKEWLDRPLTDIKGQSDRNSILAPPGAK